MAVITKLRSFEAGNQPQSLTVSLVSILLFAGTISTLTFTSILASVPLLLVIFKQSALRLPWLAAIATTAGAATWFARDLLTDRFAQQFSPSQDSFTASVGIIPETLVFRGEVWRYEIWPLVQQRPFFGWGQGLFIKAQAGEVLLPWKGWPYAESQYLQILACGGIAELLVFCLFLTLLWRLLRRASGTVGCGPQLLLALVIAGSVTVPQFTDAGFPLPFFALVGVIASGASGWANHAERGASPLLRDGRYQSGHASEHASAQARDPLHRVVSEGEA